MTSTMTLVQTSILYTRSIVLILSVVIVILSLSIYNANAIPVFTLLESDRSALLERNHGIIYDMIQDRRLIATLVAAQASILCPLFLLLGAPTTHQLPLDIQEQESEESSSRMTRMDLWRTLIEQLCQFLMPLGLAMSWLFCILFDRKTEMALISQHLSTYMASRSDDDGKEGMVAIKIVTVLKYVVVMILLIEVLAIWCSTLMYNHNPCTIKGLKKREGGIQLNEEDEEYTVYLDKPVENV